MPVFGKPIPGDLPGSFHATHGWTSSWLLPLLTIGLLGAMWIWRRSDRPGLQRVLTGLLAAAALLSVVNYTDYGKFRYGTYVNDWDVFHYYLGAKYLPELGYTKLYGAALLADLEDGIAVAPNEKLTDLERRGLGELVSAAEIVAHAHDYRSGFSEARWQAFRRDLSWFRRSLPEPRWRELLRDQGYHGTPAWSVVAGALAETLPIERAFTRVLLLSIDPLLLMGTALCVWWAFGLRSMLVVVVFVGTHYLLSWGHLKGGMFRTDFAACAAMAVCCMKRGRYTLAGVLLGWATVSRVFPIVFALGCAARFVAVMIERRTVDRLLLRFGAALSLTGLMATLLSLWRYGGTAIWEDWTSKILGHYAGANSSRMGFNVLLESETIDGVPEPVLPAVMADDPDALLRQILTMWIVRALVLLPCLFFAARLKDHQALAFAFVFVFFLVAPSYYYYLILIVPLLFFLEDWNRPGNVLGVGWMLATGAAGYVLFSGQSELSTLVVFRGWKQYFQTYYYMSWLILAQVVWAVVLAARQAREATVHPASIPEAEPTR